MMRFQRRRPYRAWRLVSRVDLKGRQNGYGDAPKLAIIGARSLPARWGGFDTVVSQLAPRLVKRGYDVTVYCQPRYSSPERPAVYDGVKLRYIPSLNSKSLEALSYEGLCALDSIRRDFDLVYVLGLRASFVHLLHKIRGRPVVMNTDGFDWQRRKWGRLARAYLRTSEAIGARFVATHLICDSRATQPYFRQKYGRNSTYIGYGATNGEELPERILPIYGLAPKSYYLIVARIEPENNIDIAIREHNRAGVSRPLVIVGAANYRSRYESQIKRLADPNRVRFLGGIYQPGHVDQLYANAYAYIHGHEVGGTNPSLLQAMGNGCASIAFDVPFNREVLGSAGRYFDTSPGTLAKQLNELDSNEELAESLGLAAQQRASRFYAWDQVIDEYDEFFRSVLPIPRLVQATDVDA
jgi:glycosyltransferase involved in cell wall biosynthesis